jgi:hypothetical protein
MWEPSRRFWSGTCDSDASGKTGAAGCGSGGEGVRVPSGIGALSGEVHDGYGAE